MKKLIGVFAVVLTAICVHAASTDWSLTVGQMYDHTGAATFAGLLEVYATGGGLSSDTVVFSENPAAATYNKTQFSSDKLVAGESYDFYCLLTDGKYTYKSAIKTVSALATGTAGIAFGSLKAATQDTKNWQSSAAPEPTSGILLLLGMAGLMLKRKRA